MRSLTIALILAVALIACGKAPETRQARPAPSLSPSTAGFAVNVFNGTQWPLDVEVSGGGQLMRVPVGSTLTVVLNYTPWMVFISAKTVALPSYIYAQRTLLQGIDYQPYAQHADTDYY